MKRASFSERLLFQYICCFLLLDPPICSAASSFKPVDAIFLNCGASVDGLDAVKRRWSNDSSASYSGSSSLSAQANKTIDLFPIPSVVPYGTARVFTSTSTYTSPDLSKGRHFLRLHFFPAYYNDLDPYNATFSVIAGAYTLLENFNPATIATNFSQAYIIHEFFITISSPGTLTLVFAPSSGTPNSFAFINGIEIVSSPELFNSGISNSSQIVNTPGITFPIYDYHVLQTVARLNVGGAYISPAGDSGLFRTWYDDTPYVFPGALKGHLFLGASGVTYSRDQNVSVQYSNAVPEYIAPPDVYGTARSMGRNASVNLNYNLTWVIQIDNGFRYLIRLHFCEIQLEIDKQNQRVFNVYVNNMTAESGFDVIAVAQTKVQAPLYTGVAVHKDYMIIMPLTTDKQSDLRIELHPDMRFRPQIADAILNGLEVFKISDFSRNLARPNPELSPATSPEKVGHDGGHKTLTIGVVVGTVTVVALGIAIILYLVLIRQQKKGKGKTKWSDVGGGRAHKLQSPLAQAKRKWFAFPTATNDSRCSEATLDHSPNTHCRQFSLSDIIAATKNFDDALLLGRGGFGKVYIGQIDGGTKVAIKRGNQLAEQGVREFKNEIEMLSRLRHRHLVSLIGYCDDSSEMILVYNYMAHGTLRQHLYGTNHPPLSWRQRLEICIGAAKGLHYLHAGATYTLIHRDVKTANILLDENWVAKVSDFGISRMGSSLECSHVSTGVKGTFGYFDPEYFRLRRLTEKSDVYSFGVVMLELLCARPVIDMSRSMEEIGLADWALRSMRLGRTEQIIDRFLEGKITPECLHRYAETAEKCLAEKSAERPSMASVVSSLEIALCLQISEEEGNKDEGLAAGYPNVSMDGGDDEGVSMSSTMLSSLPHRHLVSLVGFCDDGSEMILVYNYMAHGTLRQHLYGTNSPPLSWRRRLDICIGAAKGLHYLHAGATYTLIHRDVKTTNILLDENWVAKVSDFGLSRMGLSLDCSHVSTGVKGTFGYFDPEYFRLNRLTEKSDVYSFGVVLLEVLCARPVIDMSRPMEEIGLVEWALRFLRVGRTEQIVDPFLEGKITLECLHKFAETVEKCLAERSADRPSMANVVSSLELALFLQISEEEGNKDEGLAAGYSNVSLDGDDEDLSMSSTVWKTDDDRSVSTCIGQAAMDSRSMCLTEMKESTCWLPLLLQPIFHLLLFSSFASSTPFFKPVSILLNYGSSSDDVDADKRPWTNDSTSQFGPSNLKSSFSARASSADLSLLPSLVPYQTARIFTSASSYNFTALSEGRHFVRLHFFPAVYNDRDTKNAFFSVTTGPYTLLSNFSPAITAVALSQDYIIREFFITVSSSGYLTLTFTPSPNTSNSFAFINGIEIVSSPKLFPLGASTVPTYQIYPIRDSDALQTIVRLNVGGRYVSPTSDSGLSRTWYDDSPYIFGAGFGVSYSRDPNVSIQYSKAVPEYIAPPGVYGTARSMGPNAMDHKASINLNYNLTWSITVDNGFRYLIRLHFCEIQSEVFKEKQRVFNVYVNNMTADPGFDVIHSAKENLQADIYTGITVYRDYMVMVPRSSGRQSDLWIGLHPDLDVGQYYADAILNGLEVFKINESSGDLATPYLDHTLEVAHERGPNPTRRKGSGYYLTIAGTAGGIAVVLCICACFCYLLRRCRWAKGKGSDGDGSARNPLSTCAKTANWKSTSFSGNRSEDTALNKASNAYCRHFRISEMIAATNNFDDELLLGVGGFGTVYRGEIDGGTKVAIKRGNQLSQQGVREFRNEIEMLSTLRHRHLVSLIGYCDDNFEMILVYNHMAHGTLRQHLYATNKPPLSWRRRLDVCIGAAKGLHYLHAGATYTLIHRDVKTTNILLDENWVAKVSNFGLSRMGSSLDCSHVSTGVKGTFGYFDPEYFRLHRLTEKSDVYSFGVVLLEILCARPAIDKSRPIEEIGLADWALRSMRLGRTERIIDPFLEGKIALECLHKFAETAERCLAEQSADRPSMANVVSSLELALLLQISGEEERKGEGLAPGPSMTMDGDDEEVSISSMVWHTDDERSSSTYAEQATMDSRSISTPFFKPVSILLNCGASSDDVDADADADKRRWTNDSTTHFGPSNLQSSFSARASSADLSVLPSLVPYQTARVFTSASSYNFTTLPEGRHFVRLHFFPAVYNDRVPKNAFFSVTTGPYTLLSNFSPAITALALTQAYIMREFFVTVPSSGSLTLTFTPSLSTPDSYAFINGIEIVSSLELFPSGASTVSNNQIFPIRDSEALQTIVRSNVGGAYVSPTSDSGPSRTWYDDSPYIFGAGFGVSYSRDPNVSIKYSKAVPEYIAPPDVYGIARSMGPNASINLNYNLTWSITVDNGFRYLIRLHFCEIQSEVFEENQRVFNVYVNNMTADPGFDVILRAKENVQVDSYTGVAVYRDYMVIMPSSSGKQSDLWIGLHPDVDVHPYYADAILNGLEVFKVNDSSGNLAGPNPDLPPPAPAQENSSPIGRHRGEENSSPIGRHGGGHSHEIAGAVGGIAAALVVSACICCLLCRCQRKKKEKGSGGSGSTGAQTANWKSTSLSGNKSEDTALIKASNAYCRHFRFSEMIAATNNFGDELLLGVGGFGKVYRGEIDGGTKVAIKRGNQLSQQGVREFRNEIEMLSKLRHRHLVSLISYCDDNCEMILVYNHMAHGTLRQHLYGTNHPHLSWRQRLEICIGAAKGLHYLHAGATYTLIHRDVKTTNILLDENWVAKVSDFGLSRMGSSLDCSHVSTGVKGTFGYFDPEYFRFHRLTEKSDVYSFGVVLLEILCARPVIDMSRPMEEIGLADWALRFIRLGRTKQIIDREKSRRNACREWTNDSNTLFGPSNSQSSLSARALNADLSAVPSVVPYHTARIFTSTSSYNFTKLSEGRHFVRLHFFPAVYNDRDPKKAFFSVTAAPYTLLHNFRPALTKGKNINEFFITVPSSGFLTLTFTPSPSIPDSFAFINGIEIVSSPELFHLSAFYSASTLGTNQRFPMHDSMTLQTIVRLNVGPPTSDPILHRTWYTDDQYIFGAGYGVSYSRDPNVSIRYSDVFPDHIAPPDVYGTARSMGPNVSINLNYNLTWSITIDNGFHYLIRLHFCEIQSEVFEKNQRVFNVYVNNRNLDPGLDVILYAQSNVQAPIYTGVAVYKDYTVLIPRKDRSAKQSDLLLELHPDVDVEPYYADAILNGLEVFKVTDAFSNLSQSNPDLPIVPPTEKNVTSPTRRQGGGHRLAIGGPVGDIAVYKCQRRKKEKGSDNGGSVWMPLSLYVHGRNRWSTAFSSKKSEATECIASNAYCRHFMLAEIKAATNNFDDAFLLGVGGFGKVYRGEIDSGTKVAIKRGNQLSEQGVRELKNEIEMLSKLRHRHLVSLIGYCDDRSEMILVYNYMAHGTLRQHLYGTNKPPLSWKQRLEICIGAAKGLHYLHAGATYTLIHRDVKTTNILLDENWVAKLSDFGLSRMGSSLDCSHVSTGVKGTFGYFDPEYFRMRRLTEKSDVYSFGVVMLELLCARPVIDMSRPMEGISLSEWALHCMREGRTELIIDQFLEGKIAPECLLRFTETAYNCLAERSAERPSMANVVSSLELALALQFCADEGNMKEVGSSNSSLMDDEEASMSSRAWLTDDERSRPSVRDVQEIYEVEST
ncbi:Receptor-like protein kinase FERONIA [Nymphaea thermarum]|nr:Receptor-like protein kinase FERONIA [Nymphaea thermarum]